MTLLQCPSWDPSSTRNELHELTEPEPICSCWVGCVSMSDEARFSGFMSCAGSGDIQGLAQYQHLGGDVAYAVLLKLPEDQWKLAVIVSPEDLLSAENVVFSAIVRPGVQIKIERYES